MATHPSAEKRNRQRITRTERNRAAKSTLRTVLKKARANVKDAPLTAAEAVLTATVALDKAASKGIIPAKRASRVKSRIAKALNRASKAA